MTTVRATETFAWSGGMVHWGTEYQATDPVVKQFPGFFETVAESPARPRRGRPVGSKNKPKADAGG